MSVDRPLKIIEEIAGGKYSNDIMDLTREDHPETVRAVAEAVGLMMVKIEAREYRLEMMIQELEALNQTIRNNTIHSVSAMAHALAARDTYTEGHTARVADLAKRMAEYMGFDAEQTEYVRLAGILHDIGKIGFSDALFEPHDTRNPSEMVKEILSHPATGAAILQDLDFLGPAIEYVYCHHERPDGKGYPRKLKDGEIPLGAKILAVADAFDAMTTDRPYRTKMSFNDAIAEIERKSGTQFDPAVCAALLTYRNDLEQMAQKRLNSGK